MRWLTALVVTGVLALGTLAVAQDGGLGKRGNSSDKKSDSRSSSGSQNRGSNGGRSERPPVRESTPSRTNPGRDSGGLGNRGDSRNSGGSSERQRDPNPGLGKRSDPPRDIQPRERRQDPNPGLGNNRSNPPDRNRDPNPGFGGRSTPPDRDPYSGNSRRNYGGEQDGGLGKKDKGNGNSGGNSGGGQTGGQRPPERPPVREQTPPRTNPNRNDDRANPGQGLGKRNDDRQIPNGERIDRNSGGSGIRRPSDTVRPGQGNTDYLTKRPTPRSGQPNYQGNNNLIQNGRQRVDRPIEIQRLPADLRKGSLESQVLREGSPERVRNRGGNDWGWNNYNWRNGYCQYDNRWRDNSFCYPYYSFSWNNRCAISPWYYYSNLPGYIVSTRVRFGNFGLEIRWGDNYDWNRYNDRYDRYSNSYALGEAIDDIRDAFERGSSRSLGNLIPNRSDVYVRLEDGYGYYMSGDDFYDLMADNISSTDTIRYSIMNTRWGSRGEAQVTACHEFYDAWNRRQSVYHRFVLVQDGRYYRIAQFEVNPDRFRF